MSSLVRPLGCVEEMGVVLEDTPQAGGRQQPWLSGTEVMIRECRETS